MAKRDREATGDTPESSRPPIPQQLEGEVEQERPVTPVGDTGSVTPPREEIPPPVTTARETEGKNKSAIERTNLPLTFSPHITQPTTAFINPPTSQPSDEVKEEDTPVPISTPSRGRGKGRGGGGQRSAEARQRRAEKRKQHLADKKSGRGAKKDSPSLNGGNPFSTPPNTKKGPKTLLPDPPNRDRVVQSGKRNPNQPPAHRPNNNNNNTPPVSRPTATIEWLGEGPPDLNRLRRDVVLTHYTNEATPLRITDARTSGRLVILSLEDEDSMERTALALEALPAWRLVSSNAGTRRLVIRSGSWLHGATGQQLTNMLVACNPPVEDQPSFPSSPHSITVVGWHYQSPPGSSSAPEPPLPTHALGFLEVCEETYNAIVARGFTARGATGGLLKFEYSRRQ